MAKNAVITICLDSEALSNKPNGNTPEGKDKIGKISKRAVKNVVHITLEDFITEHMVKARTVVPAIFNKGTTGKIARSNNNWHQQQLLMIDIDNEKPDIPVVTVKEALSRCEKYGIKPFFIYHSLSSTFDNERFRVGFLYEDVIKDPSERNMVQDLLQMLFPEADHTQDRARMFFGSHSGAAYIDYEARIDVPSLFSGAYHFRKHIDPSHYRRDMQRLIRRYKLFLIHGVEPMEYAAKCPPRSLVPLDDDILTSSEKSSGGVGGNNLKEEEKFTLGEKILAPIDTIGGRTKSPILDLSSPTAFNDDVKIQSQNGQEGTNSGPRDLIKNFNFDRARERCGLLDLLLNGSDDLGYNENYLLTLNMIQIAGGQQLLLNSISTREEHPDSEYDEKERYQRTKDAIDFAKAHGYNAEGCSDVCRFYASGQCNPGWYSICQMNFGVDYKVIEQPEKVSPATARNNSRLQVQRFVSEPNLGQTLIFCSPPGSGKTNDYKDIEGALIVVPTHRFAQEVRERSNNPNVIVVPELPLHVLPRATQIAYNTAHAKGAHKTASGIIHSANKGGKYPEITKYLELVEQSKQVANTVIITHERYLIDKNEYPHELVIIDEDITKSACSCNSITASDIEAAGKMLTHHSAKFSSEDFAEIKKLIDRLVTPVGNGSWVYEKTPTFSQAALDAIDTILGREEIVKSNVIGLFSSSYYTRDTKSSNVNPHVWYIQGRDAKKEGAKTLLMSATLPRFVAEFMFGAGLDYYDVGNVETQGKIVQYREESFSKYYLDNNPGVLQKLADNLKMPIITYKNYKSDLGDCASHMHFGNTEGLNMHKGQDIAVIGTPNRPFPVYLLMAALFGLAEEGKEYSDAPVTKTRFLNGIESKFTAVSDDNILTVQNYMVLSDLIQALGRARIIDHNVVVHLFTNWPVPNAVIEKAPSWLYSDSELNLKVACKINFDESYADLHDVAINLIAENLPSYGAQDYL